VFTVREDSGRASALGPAPPSAPTTQARATPASSVPSTPLRGSTHAGAANKENAAPAAVAAAAAADSKPGAAAAPVSSETGAAVLRAVLWHVCAAQCTRIDELYVMADQLGITRAPPAPASAAASAPAADKDKDKDFQLQSALRDSKAANAAEEVKSVPPPPPPQHKEAEPAEDEKAEEDEDALNVTAAAAEIGLDFTASELQALVGTASKPKSKPKLSAAAAAAAAAPASALPAAPPSPAPSSVAAPSSVLSLPSSVMNGVSLSSRSLAGSVNGDGDTSDADVPLHVLWSERTWHHTLLRTQLTPLLDAVVAGHTTSHASLLKAVQALIGRRLRSVQLL
jgi:hypothetical protein